MKTPDPTPSREERDHRCDCGAVVCRLTERGVEIKCRRCKRVVVVPLTPETK
jgi:phage FluMu protein Com